ncbi:MAG: DUF4258 domain-containing protein [Acidimicrobiales bacterium]
MVQFVDTLEIDCLRSTVAEARIHWHQHALERCRERGIARSEVKTAIVHGELIEPTPMNLHP